MHCRNCGQVINEKAEICIHCKSKPLAGTKYCQECGGEPEPNVELCTKCGCRLMFMSAVTSVGTVLRTDFSGLTPYYQEEFKKMYDSNEAYKGKFNWAALLFGVLWALTKGVWLASVICFVACIVTGGLAGIIFWVIFGVRGNYMYYNAYVKNKQLPI